VGLALQEEGVMVNITGEWNSPHAALDGKAVTSAVPAGHQPRPGTTGRRSIQQPSLGREAVLTCHCHC
jgi:hypothetical protein